MFERMNEWMNKGYQGIKLTVSGLLTESWSIPGLRWREDLLTLFSELLAEKDIHTYIWIYESTFHLAYHTIVFAAIMMLQG